MPAILRRRFPVLALALGHGSYRPQTGKVDYAYTYATVHPGVLVVHHEQDISLPALNEASGGRCGREYTSYARVMPALAGLPLTPFALGEHRPSEPGRAEIRDLARHAR